MDVFDKIKVELSKRSGNPWAECLLNACEEIKAEERAKHEKAKYDFERDPGFIICGND
jgi:hypothetical protein